MVPMVIDAGAHEFEDGKVGRPAGRQVAHAPTLAGDLGEDLVLTPFAHRQALQRALAWGDRAVPGNHRAAPRTVGTLRRSSSAARTSATRREAAAIIKRIVETLPLPGRVEAYLRGYAEGLEAKR